MVCTEVDGQDGRDEIAEYEDLRSVGSSEAVWHLMAYPIARKYPAVQALRVHLEGDQQVHFDEGQEEAALETGRKTELTAFFQLNATEEMQASPEQRLKYVDMPKMFPYDLKTKKWIKRKNKCNTIG